VLDSVLFRVGILAALRSKKLDGKTIGVVITASHNPEEVRPLTPADFGHPNPLYDRIME
jgi:phosphoglucomutase